VDDVIASANPFILTTQITAMKGARKVGAIFADPDALSPAQPAFYKWRNGTTFARRRKHQ
jgi:hypothetical protein